MNNISQKLQEMRNQQLTRGIRAAAIIGFFTLLGSILRTWFVGWNDIIYLHIFFYLVILATAILDRRISLSSKTILVLVTLYSLGIAGLISWGLGAFSLPALFCFCFLSTMLLGIRTGIAACILSAAAIGLTGLCVYAGILHYKFNAAVHLNAPITWLLGVLTIILFAGIIVVILGTLNSQVEDLIQALEKRNDELLQSNLLLRCEIAERVRAEEERQKCELKLQAARKMEAVGTVAGGVAHDLNNILGGIVSYPDMLLEDLPSQSPMRATLETIKKSGLKAAAIVNDMLTLARRRIELKEAVNLNAVIADYCISPEFKRLKQFHPSVEVEVLADPKLANILGSPFHLSKIIMNLVSNAAEAMPDGGCINISTENRIIDKQRRRCGELAEGSYAVLSVADTGIGIPAEDLKKIFDPFYSKKKMGRSGTGLGMAVVYGSVADHDGYIDVSSVEGKGTIFDIFFPATNHQIQAANPPISKSNLRGRGESIVIIDDVAEQREIACKILMELGYSVRAFGSGEEAIEFLRTSTADLLILDMLMDPGMDGLETYKRATQLHPGQKAIITTGYAETARLTEALQAGVGCYLKKPFLMDDIGAAVRGELDKRLKNDFSGIWN
jgi:signal transduction histidine kinase/CheY-like chemotaxis protein